MENKALCFGLINIIIQYFKIKTHKSKLLKAVDSIPFHTATRGTYIETTVFLLEYDNSKIYVI